MLLIVIVLVIVAMLIITMFIHLEHKLKAIKAIVLILILLIIGSSVYTWVKNDTNDLSSPKGIVNSIYMYVGWLGSTGAAIVDSTKDSFTIVGNAINGNSTTNNNNFDGRK